MYLVIIFCIKIGLSGCAENVVEATREWGGNVSCFMLLQYLI